MEAAVASQLMKVKCFALKCWVTEVVFPDLGYMRRIGLLRVLSASRTIATKRLRDVKLVMTLTDAYSSCRRMCA